MRSLLIGQALCLAAACPAQDFGPLSTRNFRPLSLPFLRFEPHWGVLPAGARQIDLSLGIANESRQLSHEGRSVIEDAETWRWRLRARRGFGRGHEVSVEVPVLARGGGVLDPLIDSWHEEVLGWSDPWRNATPFGRSTVRTPGSRAFGSALGIGDVVVGAARRVTDRLLAKAAFKLPTGDPGRLLGSGGFDAGASVQARVPLRNGWDVFAQAALVAQSPGSALSSVRGLVHQESLALVWRRGRREAWVAQWQGEESATVTGVPGSDAPHRILAFGYQRRVGDAEMLEVAITEDRDVFMGAWPEGANVGPDFAVLISWSRRW